MPLAQFECIAHPREHEVNPGADGIEGSVEVAPPALDAHGGLIRQLAGHGADPFPTVDIAQVELYRLNRPFDQPTRIVVAEHG